MKKFVTKKRFCIITAALIFFISIFLEAFVFNLSYFKMSKVDRGIHNVKKQDIILKNMKFEDNKLYITGTNPYFKISSDRYVSFLKLELYKGSESFSIYSGDSKGNVSKVYNSNSDVKNFVYIEVNKNIKNIKFYITASNNKKYISIKSISEDNKFYFNIIRFILIFGFLYLIFMLVVYREFLKKNLHIAFLIISLTLGTIISICVPPYYSFDECAHFIRTYETASFDFNFSRTKKSSWVSNIDEFFSYNAHNDMYNSYKDRLSNAEIFSKNDYSNVKHFNSPEDTYLFVPYVPAAIGIFIGKLLKLPFILTFYLGRLFSLLIYSLIGAFIIKHIKIAKRLVFMILLFPPAIVTAGAYSVDPMTNILTIGSVAIFIDMLFAKKNSIIYKKIIGFGFCIALASMCKVPYAPLSLLIFAVPDDKFKTYKNINVILSKILSLIPVGLAAAGTFLYGIIKHVNQWAIPGVNPKGQILFIIKNLPEYIYIVYKFTATNILGDFQAAISLLAYCGSIDSIWCFIILITLFVVAFSDDESDILNLNKKEKIIILISVLLSWGLAISALCITFTPVGKNTIDGVQGRYIIPLLLPLFLLFKNNKIVNKFKKENLNYLLIVEFAVILMISALKIFLQFNN
ncbi:MAG: DUF2142 domain-containing protein [Clostridium sp.]|nr:DUF2142 domain-containing protein [Clostridium sp.]